MTITATKTITIAFFRLGAIQSHLQRLPNWHSIVRYLGNCHIERHSGSMNLFCLPFPYDDVID